jgi:nucleoside-diphosphate-sugar epimerase
VDKRIYITGNKGFIGSFFKESGCDLLDGTNVSEGINGNWDTIIHLAAFMKNEPNLLENNIKSTEAVVEYCLKNDTHLIFTSSAAVYGDAEIFPTPESTKPKPINEYGLSKALGEDLVRKVRRHTIFRLSNVFPKKDSAYGKLKSGGKLYGDGGQIRDFIHVNEVVLAIKKAAQEEIYGTFNLSSGRGITMNLFYKTFIGDKPQYTKAPPGEIKTSILDNRKWQECF